jgi:para-aminobenzoate synthetase component 1
MICNIILEEKTEINSPIQLKSRIAKEDYLQKIATIKNHILEGDIYEMNFCRELYNEDATINPLNTFFELNEKSKAPFSSFFKINEHYILCASPERFLQKNEDLLISQPIKGTVKRGASQEEDEFLKSELYHSEKERAENIMIVDLVRNDLTHFAKTGSIQVKELFGIYTFNTVHHMISTIVATLSDSKNYISAVKKAFPMGSMTGAPKIKSMQLIEQYEQSKRGVFSGSIGYFTPENNFDFNVVIRTILYNKKNKYLSVQSGGAITIDSLPEAEWDELQLKSALIENILNKK